MTIIFAPGLFCLDLILRMTWDCYIGNLNRKAGMHCMAFNLNDTAQKVNLMFY